MNKQMMLEIIDYTLSQIYVIFAMSFMSVYLNTTCCAHGGDVEPVAVVIRTIASYIHEATAVYAALYARMLLSSMPDLYVQSAFHRD